MKDYRLARINNTRFSNAFCIIAKVHGYYSVGSFEKALKRAIPNIRWYKGSDYVRGSKLLKEITIFKTTYLMGE